MRPELWALVLAALLSLALAVMTIAIHFARYGGPMIRSNRDDFPPLDGLAARVVRAHHSLNEALLPFGAIVVAVLIVHGSTATSAIAAIVFCVARAAHAVLYLLGATPWRSISYYIGLVATLVLASQLPWMVWVQTR